MKGVKQRIAALITAAAAVCSLGTSVFAVFTDPAEAYAQFYISKGNMVVASENSDTQENSDTSAVTKNNKKQPVAAESVEIYSYRSIITVGESFKLNYRITPENSNDKITYTTSSSKVAKVDADGNVTGVKKGTATITVKTASGALDRISVSVKNADEVAKKENSGFGGAESIELMHSSVTLYQNEKYQVRYDLSPAGIDDTVTFSSSNKRVATVTAKGVITAKSAGTTKITCTTGSGVQSKLTVNVLPVETQEEVDSRIEGNLVIEYDAEGNIVPSAVRFAEESASVQVGSTINLDARIYPSGSKYTYTIESDAPSVAKVDRAGNVKGLKPGNAVITLTTDNGKTDSIYITVYGDVISGIDVSKWNGDIDWKTVSRTGEVQFAMIRASYGYEDTDPMVDENVKGCEKYGIPYGFYHYMYARNTAEAKKEAAYFLNVIQNYSPEYPVVLDIEEEFYKQMDKKTVTAIVTTFMEAVENAGYYAMIYSFAKFFDDCLIMDKVEKYDIWVACWGDTEKLSENYSYHYGMWQYSETGRIDGIEEDVDLNYSYKDYKATIRKYGLNNLN